MRIYNLRIANNMILIQTWPGELDEMIWWKEQITPRGHPSKTRSRSSQMLVNTMLQTTFLINTGIILHRSRWLHSFSQSFTEQWFIVFGRSAWSRIWCRGASTWPRHLLRQPLQYLFVVVEQSQLDDYRKNDKRGRQNNCCFSVCYCFIRSWVSAW